MSSSDSRLSPEIGVPLLRLCKAAITGADLPLHITATPPEPVEGVFVTLYRGGELRGCVGKLTLSEEELTAGVKEAARCAAYQDPRFPSLNASELPEVSIEISLLTPFERVEGPQGITVGLHGICVRRGAKSGLFLPKVAARAGWDAKTFVDKARLEKAGMSRREMDEGFELYRFRAYTLEESWNRL